MKEFQPIESEPQIAAEPVMAYGNMNNTPYVEKRMSGRCWRLHVIRWKNPKQSFLNL